MTGEGCEEHRSTAASFRSIVDGLEISLPSHENLGESFTNDNLGGAAYCLDSNEDLGVLSILLSTARFHGEIETTSCNSLETVVSIAFPAILGDRLSGIFCSPASLTSVLHLILNSNTVFCFSYRCAMFLMLLLLSQPNLLAGAASTLMHLCY